MKTFKYLAVALVALLGIGAQFASAQSYYPGSLATTTPNYSFPAQSFTATNQTGAAIGLGGLTSGVIQVTGTDLTTVTFAIQGSIDGGVTWFNLPTAAYPTTAKPSTLAVTQTAAAPTLYVVNLSGITTVRFVTSGTFTATSVAVKLTASSNQGYL